MAIRIEIKGMPSIVREGINHMAHGIIRIVDPSDLVAGQFDVITVQQRNPNKPGKLISVDILPGEYVSDDP